MLNFTWKLRFIRKTYNITKLLFQILENGLRSDYPARGGFHWALDWLCSTRVSDTSRLYSQSEHSMIQSNSSLSYNICSLRSYFNLRFGAWIRNCYTQKNYSVEYNCTNIAGSTTFSVHYCRVTPAGSPNGFKARKCQMSTDLDPKNTNCGFVSNMITWWFDMSLFSENVYYRSKFLKPLVS